MRGTDWNREGWAESEAAKITIEYCAVYNKTNRLSESRIRPRRDPYQFDFDICSYYLWNLSHLSMWALIWYDINYKYKFVMIFTYEITIYFHFLDFFLYL